MKKLNEYWESIVIDLASTYYIFKASWVEEKESKPFKNSYSTTKKL